MARDTDATAGTETIVVPGPIRGGHCPPPREIVLVDARKVFDFCTQEDLLERCFTIPNLGTGATITLFGVVKQVLLTPLPYSDPQSIAVVWSAWKCFDQTWLSYD